MSCKFSKKLVALALLATLFGLTGCQTSKTAAPQQISVGVTAGPHAEIMEEVKKVAAKDGLDIKIVEFNDYIQPNVALNSGDILANSFQHQPYLDNIIKDRKYDIVSVAKTVIYPMAIYSTKIKNLSELKDGATVAIPNDPTNGARALMMLEKQGFLKLKAGDKVTASVADIVENPKNLKIVELDAAQIPRSLADMDIAAINTNYAITANLNPSKDALAVEDGDSPYANVIAVRTKDKDNPLVQKLIHAYQSDEVKQFIQEHFKGSAIAVW